MYENLPQNKYSTIPVTNHYAGGDSYQLIVPVSLDQSMSLLSASLVTFPFRCRKFSNNLFKI